jgi:hypothetical protein
MCHPFKVAAKSTLLSTMYAVLGFVCTAWAQSPGEALDIQVEGPRPLAKAADILERRHGIVITYEDPGYYPESDLADITREVSRNLHKNARKVIGVRRSSLQLNYVRKESGTLGNVPNIIGELLKEHAKRGNPGVFRQSQSDTMLHIIPTAAQGETGQSIQDGPALLDARITFDEQVRDGIETLKVIVGEVQRTTGKKVTLGMLPLNKLFQLEIKMGASDEVARDVLIRFAKDTNIGLSWRLFYDPGLKWFALNMHRVSDGQQAQAATSRPG